MSCHPLRAELMRHASNFHVRVEVKPGALERVGTSPLGITILVGTSRGRETFSASAIGRFRFQNLQILRSHEGDDQSRLNI